MEKQKCFKCKDCIWFKKEAMKYSRSGRCCHERFKNSEWGDCSYLMGVNTKACEYFKERRR